MFPVQQIPTSDLSHLVVQEVVSEVSEEHIAYIVNSENTNVIFLRIFVKNLQRCGSHTSEDSAQIRRMVSYATKRPKPKSVLDFGFAIRGLWITIYCPLIKRF